MSAYSKELQSICEYYNNKITTFGTTPAGVDWNSLPSQEIRFLNLLKICTKNEFSLNDIGCGYGALYDYLTKHNFDCDYLGMDISQLMVDQAKSKHHQKPKCTFSCGTLCSRIADYSVASGIFNVKLNCDIPSWEKHILKVLEQINTVSSAGFAFNCLTKYSDIEYMKDNLYYADPGYFFDYCKKNFSKNVALLHDYDLYEFTVLVRKQT